MARLLLGPRARAQYPGRRLAFEEDASAPYYNPYSNASGRRSPQGQANTLFSRQSLMVLTIGILFGYLLLPMLLVQHLPFDDLSRLPQSSLSKPPTTTHTFTASNFDTTANRVRGNAKSEPIQTPKMPSRSLIPKVKDLSTAEQRLVEDHNVLAQQSLPTSNTPHVMKTILLPDHQRKKILVTGGAGFVGSHLVDKLMMEGHEVTVVDNFFTGQKRNIAHWLHHPNFRYVHLILDSNTKQSMPRPIKLKHLSLSLVSWFTM